MAGPCLLLDADVLCHQMAYSSTKKVDWNGDGEITEILNPQLAIANIDGYIAELIQNFKASDVLIVLSSYGDQFRKKLDDTYKSRRNPKPTLWEFTRNHLEFQVDYRVVILPRLEGDDTLGLLATEATHRGNHILVSIDKDMKTVPCRLFNPLKRALGVVPVTAVDGAMFHMYQTLVGDTTDGYPGLPGAGEKAWLKIAATAECPKHAWELVLEAYRNKGYREEDALLQARLAFILRDGWYNYRTQKVRLWNPTQLP